MNPFTPNAKIKGTISVWQDGQPVYASTYQAAINKGVDGIRPETYLVEAENGIKQRISVRNIEFKKSEEIMKKGFNNIIDSESFYELMQGYRHAPMSDHDNLLQFQNVKDFVKIQHSESVKEMKDALETALRYLKLEENSEAGSWDFDTAKKAITQALKNSAL